MNILCKKYSATLWNQYQSNKIAVIPDIKARSPQAGDLLQGRDPVIIAEALAAVGAPVLSVVIEPRYFGGSPELLQRIVQATSLPILCKDFINKREQLKMIVEMGASAVLLIASMLEKEQLYKLFEDAMLLGLEPLVETHNKAEIILANELNLTMIGINNRNIVELEMDDGGVSTTEELVGLINARTLIISESSISSSLDVQRAIAAGAHAVLVGTAILQAHDPAAMYRSLSEAGMKCP